MSVGLFLLLKDVRPGAGRFAGVVTDISRLSYGIYLIHIMLLNFFHGWLDPLIVSAGIKIPVLALCTFVSSYAVVKLIARQQIRRRVATTRTPRRNAIAARPSAPAGCRRP